MSLGINFPFSDDVFEQVTILLSIFRCSTEVHVIIQELNAAGCFHSNWWENNHTRIIRCFWSVFGCVRLAVDTCRRIVQQNTEDRFWLTTCWQNVKLAVQSKFAESYQLATQHTNSPHFCCHFSLFHLPVYSTFCLRKLSRSFKPSQA